MKVRALKSFGGGGVHKSAGDIFDLPAGSDWLSCGHVEVYDPDRSAVLPPPEPRKVGAGLAPVHTVKGIGKKTAETLAAAGIRYVVDLSVAEPDKLAALPGIGEVAAWRYIKSAREALS